MCKVEELQDELSISHLSGHEDMISGPEIKEQSVKGGNGPLSMAELDGKILGGKPCIS